jgi:hypothetical protein
MEATMDTTTLEPEQLQPDAVPLCELAECTCPDFCERDHDLD